MVRIRNKSGQCKSEIKANLFREMTVNQQGLYMEINAGHLPKLISLPYEQCHTKRPWSFSYQKNAWLTHLTGISPVKRS